MIQLTSAAIQELQRLTKYQHRLADLRIRLALEPVCCADWSYVLQPETVTSDQSEEETLQITQNGFTIVVSQSDIPLLNGLTIDYSEDLVGGAFRYQNPNAAYTCDCGNSFSTTLPETDSSKVP